MALVICIGTSSEIYAAGITTKTASAIDPVEVIVRARRIDRPADPIEDRIHVPGQNTLALPDGLWEIGLDTDAFWAPRMYMRNTDSVILPVWPAVALKGVTKPLTTKLAVAFTPLDPNGATGEADCNLREESWNCAIPPGRYDLRFVSPGYAPEYRFGMAVPNDGDVTLQFTAGASLSGRLEAARGTEVSLENIELSLIADGTNTGRRFTAKSNAKGFFQFKGIPPGQYSLRARRQNLTAQARSVTIVSGAAAELNAPLLLDRPKRLTVTIFPSLDPDLQPWRVSLSMYVGGSERSAETVSESAAAPNGEWSASGLIAGRYRLNVQRANGEMWKSEALTIADTDVTLPLSAVGERIHGRITLGDRPIAARLSFGGEGGFTLVSDDDGRFEGDIPPGESDERTVFVDAENLQIVRNVRVKLERTESGVRAFIRLPATTLIGRVVRADGSPASGAILTVSRPRDVHQAFSKEDGRFQMTGIDPGEYRVSAESDGGRSEAATVRLTSDAPAEVELILQSDVVVRGRVAIGNIPVIQADVHAIPRDTQWAPFMPRSTTNERGRFELTLPPRTSIYDLVVVHPGFDSVLTRLPVQTDHVRHIVATQIGGTLVVDSPSPADLLLRHANGECWLSWLAGLPGAGGTVEPARVVVPRLEPGEYSVCASKTNKCERGYLPPYGTLTLALD